MKRKPPKLKEKPKSPFPDRLRAYLSSGGGPHMKASHYDPDPHALPSRFRAPHCHPDHILTEMRACWQEIRSEVMQHYESCRPFQRAWGFWAFDLPEIPAQLKKTAVSPVAWIVDHPKFQNELERRILAGEVHADLTHLRYRGDAELVLAAIQAS